MREYQVWMLFCGQESDPLWHWENWQILSTEMTDVLSKVRGKPIVDVGQVDVRSSKYVKFGRIPWNTTGFERWTHLSPLTKDSCGNWLFEWASVMCPSLSVAVKEKITPDLYFIVRKVPEFNLKLCNYNQVVLLAIVSSLESEGKAAISAIGKIGHAVLTVTRRQGWTYRLDGSHAKGRFYEGAPANLWKTSARFAGDAALSQFTDSDWCVVDYNKGNQP